MGDRLVWAICALVSLAAFILVSFALHLAAEKILEHRMRASRNGAQGTWDSSVLGGDINSTR